MSVYNRLPVDVLSRSTPLQVVGRWLLRHENFGHFHGFGQIAFDLGFAQDAVIIQQIY